MALAGTCAPTVTPVPVASTVTGIAGVEYETATGRYVLTWKADASLAGSCRLVTITLNDGTAHALKFKFN
jgi:hypothetical protein